MGVEFRWDKYQQKKSRVLILFLILLVTVLFWQMRFRSMGQRDILRGIPATTSVGSQFGVEPLSPGFSLSGGPTGYHNPFADYPPPSMFKTFTYGLGLYSDKTALSITGRCGDYYYAVLIYSTEVDYRDQPNMALYNSAQPCVFGKTFTDEINLNSQSSIRAGKYYYFIADQGKGSLWRNPR